jgi:hypothetical protein
MNAIPDDDSAPAVIRMSRNREELQHIFIGEEETEGQSGAGRHAFPRSKTMRLLTGNGGIALLAIGAGSLLLMKPKLLMRAARMIPMSAVARMVAARILTR